MSSLVSYHAHTRWSDGRNTIAEMVAAARQRGLAEFGLSDHWAQLPGHPEYSWAIPQARLAEYVAALRAAADHAGVPVLLGIEVDYFPGTEALMAEVLRQHPFDYAIGSVHFAGEFPIDADPRHWTGLSQEQIDAVYRTYWGDVRRVAQCGLFDWVGHLDLPKKFGFPPHAALDAEIAAALEAIAAAGIAIELNTAGWDKPCAEAYPSEALLRQCRARNIPVLVSDDAHCVAELARHQARAVELLRRVGYRETVRFRHRQRRVEPL